MSDSNQTTLTISLPTATSAKSTSQAASLAAIQTSARNTPPATVSGFTCYGVAISAPDILPDIRLRCTNVADDPGIIVGYLPAGGAASSIDITVPTGGARVISVFGVVSSIGCPDMQPLLNEPGSNRFVGIDDPILLATTTTDVYADTTVSMQTSYNPANATRMFTDCDNGGSSDPGATSTAVLGYFNHPQGVATDIYGNVFVADTGNHTIRKITSNGIITTVAGLAGSPGFADGTGTAALFYSPEGIAVDSAGNIYVADTYNQVIRKITSAGVVTTVAGTHGVSGFTNGNGTAATFNNPAGLAVDVSGNIYVADTTNSVIRKITSAGVVTTLAGSATPGAADGTGTSASFRYPRGIAIDSAGTLYIADYANYTIRELTPAGVVTTLAGTAGDSALTDGSGAAARFNSPYAIAASSGFLYVTDYNTVRKIAIGAAVVTTIVGQANASGSQNGSGTAATFALPYGIAVSSSQTVYVADTLNNLIRDFTTSSLSVGTLAGSGVAGSSDSQ